MENNEKIMGIVEFFNNAKGWGVVKAVGESYFVHHSNIVDKRFFPTAKPTKFRTLKSGQQVTFVASPGVSNKLKAATQVEIVSENS